MINQRREMHTLSQGNISLSKPDLDRIRANIVKLISDPKYFSLLTKLQTIATDATNKYNALRPLIQKDIGKIPPTLPSQITPTAVEIWWDGVAALQTSIDAETAQAKVEISIIENYNIPPGPRAVSELNLWRLTGDICTKKYNIGLLDTCLRILADVFTW